MASTDLLVYIRIRLPSEEDIIAMAIEWAKSKKVEDVMKIVQPYVDIAFHPFDDDAPSIAPEDLADLIKTLKVTIE